jgi:arylformamidase
MSQPLTLDLAAVQAGTAWFDVSWPVSPSTTLWPTAPPITLQRRLDLDHGDAATDTTLTMSLHTGTHVDAPAHFVQGGATIERVPLTTMVGSAIIVEVDTADTQVVTAQWLQQRLGDSPAPRILLRAHVDAALSAPFDPSFTGISVDAAQWLVDHGVCLIGTDYLSIEPFSSNGDVHRTLLGAGIVILEALRLAHVPVGAGTLLCLPVAMHATEAAPARALFAPHPVGPS